MSNSTTLLRFARVRRPKVHDLALRADAVPELKARIEAADGQGKRDATDRSGDGLPELSHDYRTFLKERAPVDRLLPSRDDIDPHRAEALANLRRDAGYRDDLKRLLEAAIDHKLAGRDAEADMASRKLQLLEALPALASTSTRASYAPAVLSRFSAPAPKKDESERDQRRADEQEERKDAERRAKDQEADAVEIETVLDDIRLLWRARNREVREARQAALRETASPDVEDLPQVEPDERPRPERKAVKASKAAEAERTSRRSEQRDYRNSPQRAQLASRMAALRERQRDRARRLAELKERTSDTSVARALATPAAKLAGASGGLSEQSVMEAQARVSKYAGLKPAEMLSFCQAYEALMQKLDMVAAIKPKSGGAASAQALAPAPNCFGEVPVLDFEDRVELLGIAELIKLEEHFMGYSEAEISYVENILAGELRVREVKTAREFEQIDVETTLESSVTTEETRASTTQSLASEIATAVNSRFNTDVSASASGSAGGTIGVVSLEGQGSLDLGVGLGLDTSFTSTDRSEFGSEIIEAATEAVTKSTQTSRTTRTKSLFKTLNRHEIDNRADGAAHRRGVYCFLNKHVCVTETPYGLRWFLKATLLAPGRNLLCDRLVRIAQAMNDAERPPEFDITPADINPSNYLALAGRFKAQGLAPPPPAVRHLARTYKTDQTNLTTEQSQGLEKIGQTLMPVFKAYNRHLITDTIAVPDGYAVMEVRLAINHGSNGLAVPVDLPLKLAGAGFFLPPTLYFWGILLLPMALWQILMLASPLLHHNTDSSAVTATIGTEAQESLYYFFEADFLVRELMQMIGGFAAMGEDIMAEIGDLAAGLPARLNQHATDLVNSVQGSIDAVVGAVGDVFTTVSNSLSSLAAGDLPGLINAFIAAFSGFGTAVSAAMGSLPTDLFEPLNDFITEVVQIISDAAQSAMSDLLAALVAGSENNQERAFAESFGTTGELPVALNIVSIKPGITVNLVACAARTNEALDAWRLETFGKLHQSYLQLVAAFETQTFFGRSLTSAKSPATLREEERQAIHHLALHALNQVWPDAGPTRYSLKRINLFEHSIDWSNMTYRVYGYGPDRREIGHERDGVFNGADAQRRAFLNAAWAQVMLPLSADPALESAMLAYFESGATDIGAGLGNDELAALWRDVILRRDLFAEAPEPLSKREVTLPTDLIVLRSDDSLPAITDTPCAT